MGFLNILKAKEYRKEDNHIRYYKLNRTKLSKELGFKGRVVEVNIIEDEVIFRTEEGENVKHEKVSLHREEETEREPTI